MFDLSSIGKWLIVAGLGLAAVGGLVWLVGRTGLPFGRLPGDIRVEREGLSCYFPLASMILVSILLTIGLNVIVRLLRK